MHDKLFLFIKVLTSVIAVLADCNSGNYTATDRKTSFTEGNCSDIGHLAFLRCNASAQLAFQISEYLVQGAIWIRFGGNVTMNDTVGNDSLWEIQKNFTMDLSDDVCIAVNAEFLNMSVWKWTTHNCSDSLSTLCSTEPPREGDDETRTTNTAPFQSNIASTTGSISSTAGRAASTMGSIAHTTSSEAPTTASTVSSSGSTVSTAGRTASTMGSGTASSPETKQRFLESTTFTNSISHSSAPNLLTHHSDHPSVTATTTGDIDSCNFTHRETRYLEIQDILAFESEFLDYARIEDGSCNIEEEGDNEAFTALLLAAHECDEHGLSLGSFTASCSNETTDGKYAMAIIPVEEEKLRELITEEINDYDQNRRILKLIPANIALLSFSFLNSSNVYVQGFPVTFLAPFSSDDTLLTNAFNLTFVDGENGLLAATHRFSGYNPECVFINVSTGLFDTRGCTCVEVEEERVRCVSNHTTIFSVLLSVDLTTVPSSVKVLSIVTLTMSLFFLAVAFFILFRVRKKVRGERIAIQINLVVSLFCLCFVIVWSDIAVHNPFFCRMVAVLTHFFALSTALWMTNEAILLFLKTSKWAFLTTKRRKLVISAMVFAWGTAFVLCSITAIVGFVEGTYMEETDLYKRQQRSTVHATSIHQYDYCWLNGKSGIRWAVIVPILFLILVNMAVSVKVAVFVYRKRKEGKNFKPTEQVKNKHKLDAEHLNHLSASIKAFVLLMPTLGIPWLLLLASNSTQETVRLAFMYINAIVNGLQGVFVFILYCIVGREVRAATVKTFSSLSSSWFSISDNLDRRRKKSGAINADKTTADINSVHASINNSISAATSKDRV